MTIDEVDLPRGRHEYDFVKCSIIYLVFELFISEVAPSPVVGQRRGNPTWAIVYLSSGPA